MDSADPATCAKALQPALIYNIINNVLEYEEFEEVLTAAVQMGPNGFSLDDAVSCLNIASDHILQRTKAFPSIELLSVVQQLIERLHAQPRRSLYLSAVASWHHNIARFIQRLFQTFNIENKYTELCFELSAACVTLLGNKWFTPGEVFPVLLCSLSSGRLRIVAEDPKEIKPELLVPVLTVLEFFLSSIEDSNFFSDKEATKMSYHIREACIFLFDYLAECRKESQQVPLSILLIIYKFLCTFLFSGGDQMVPTDSVNGSVESLFSVAEQAVVESDSNTAEMLLYVLPVFKTLPERALSFMTDFLELERSPDNQMTALIQVTSVIEQLAGRKDFFTSSGKRRAIETATRFHDDRLCELFADL